MDHKQLVDRISLCIDAANVLPQDPNTLSLEDLNESYDKFVKKIDVIIKEFITRDKLIHLLNSAREYGFNVEQDLDKLSLQELNEIYVRENKVARYRKIISDLNELEKKDYESLNLPVEELESMYENLLEAKTREMLLRKCDKMKEYLQSKIPDNYHDLSTKELKQIYNDSKDVYEKELEKERGRQFIESIIPKLFKVL